jgi:hypothetical protein
MHAWLQGSMLMGFVLSRMLTAFYNRMIVATPDQPSGLSRFFDLATSSSASQHRTIA